MVNSGLSKWTVELKRGTTDSIITHPILCDCGYERPIGGDGGQVASFFYEKYQYVCGGCGRILGEQTYEEYMESLDKKINKE